MNKKLVIVTADDHSVITKYMSFILKEIFNDAEIFQFNTLKDIVKFLENSTLDLIILDISFPDGNAINILPTIKKFHPKAKILIFSGQEEEVYGPRYINAGANGFISKLSVEDEIQLAIKEVVNNGKYLSKKLQEKIMDNFIFNKPINPFEQLSNRELEITELLIKGLGNIEICNTLHLQKSTVSTYKNRIFEKLEVSNIPELIQLYKLYSY